MGWDAHTSFKTNKVLDKFRKASNIVKSKAGSVDGGLCEGYLDCKLCARMLDYAIGIMFITGVKKWTEKEVEHYHTIANWNFNYNDDDIFILGDGNNYWAYLSAKHFLEVCAESKLSVKFSM